MPRGDDLQVPAAGGGRIASFLRHAWVFDRSGATATDEKRTELYREQGERNRFKTAATSFREFIDGLNLQVSIEPPTPRDYERAAQLTQRTNQFNSTGIRTLSSELGALLESGERRMLMVSARDRFGDYGQVGLAVLMADGEKLVVENILMSCRVLGKGVEHRLMAAIGREAQRLGAGDGGDSLYSHGAQSASREIFKIAGNGTARRQHFPDERCGGCGGGIHSRNNRAGRDYRRRRRVARECFSAP